MSRWYTWIICTILTCAFCLPAQASALRLGHSQPNASPYHRGAERFAALLSAKTGGKLKVDIYGEALIDEEPGLASRVSRGSLDMAIITAGNLTRFNPDFLIFELPHLIKDYGHVERILSGEVGKNLAATLEKRGLKVLSYWESGFRHFSNSVRPVNTPEDLRGLRVATPNWIGAIEIADAYGAIARPMPERTFYYALQDGTVDGQAGPVFALRASKLYEWQKYLTLDRHSYMPAALVINPQRLQNMPDANRTAIMQAAEEAGFYQRRIIRDQEVSDLQFLTGPGKMELVYIEDKEPWIKATERVFETLVGRVNTKLVAKVRALGESPVPPVQAAILESASQK